MAFTYFFRDKQSIDYTIDHLIPFIQGRSKIKVWDAGCASGEEPYSFIILLAERMNKHSFRNLEVHATDVDISKQFKTIIDEGVYPYEKLQRIPPEFFKKYFRKINGNGSFQIVDEIRSRIRYKRENLLSYKPTDNGFSLVICKNVLLHQTAEQRNRILEMFHDALLPGGMLVMEHTQKLPPALSDKYEPVTKAAQLYRKKLPEN
jgi:chemotaxis protein methyltransferase CheR